MRQGSARRWRTRPARSPRPLQRADASGPSVTTAPGREPSPPRCRFRRSDLRAPTSRTLTHQRRHPCDELQGGFLCAVVSGDAREPAPALSRRVRHRSRRRGAHCRRSVRRSRSPARVIARARKGVHWAASSRAVWARHGWSFSRALVNATSSPPAVSSARCSRAVVSMACSRRRVWVTRPSPSASVAGTRPGLGRRFVARQHPFPARRLDLERKAAGGFAKRLRLSGRDGRADFSRPSTTIPFVQPTTIPSALADFETAHATRNRWVRFARSAKTCFPGRCPRP